MFLHISVSASLPLPVFLFLFATMSKRANKKDSTFVFFLSLSAGAQTKPSVIRRSEPEELGLLHNTAVLAAAVEEPWKWVIPT